MANSPINNLDFDQIKDSLKTYLKSQDQFKDYNFEGSGLNVLLDVLAYNTHYGAYYANMVANETFIDSANKRQSVVSIAKHLNYTPKSYKSSVGTVDVKFTGSDVSSRVSRGLYVSERDRFTTRGSESQTFVFLSKNTVQVKEYAGEYYAKGVEIREGTLKNISYVFDSQDPNQSFEIPDTKVDIDSITVRVQDSITDNTGFQTIWKKTNDINLLNSSSQVYFIQENYDGRYEIYFGDNVLGLEPENGNVIYIEYISCNGDSANGIGLNETDSSPAFVYAEEANALVRLVGSTTYGGSKGETISSIKYYAPRNYQAQERAVTAEDYRVILHREYGENAQSVFVWGGEDSDPPQYGKVFISIKPRNSLVLTQTEKLSISKNILKQKNVITITPEIVDPDYTFIEVSSEVLYDPIKSNINSSTLAGNIKVFLLNYSYANLEQFDRSFRLSNFTSYIDDLYPSIVSNTTSISLQKRIEPKLSLPNTYTLKYNNAFDNTDGLGVLSSTGFGYYDPTTNQNVDAYLDDDGKGNVRIYRLVGSTRVYINSSIGTIDYTKGVVTLVSFNPQYIIPLTDSYIGISVSPYYGDIVAKRNQILLFDSLYTNVTCIPETQKFDPYTGSGGSFPFKNRG